MKPKKLFFFLTSCDAGGAQIFVKNLASYYMNSKNVECVVISGPPKEGCANIFTDSFYSHVVIPSLSNGMSLKKLLASFFDIVRLLHLNRGSVNVANSGVASLIVRLACLVSFNKCFFVVHGWSYIGWRKFPVRLLYYIPELFLEIIDWTFCFKIFVSNFDRKSRPLRTLNLFGGRVIHNGVFPPNFSLIKFRLENLLRSNCNRLLKLNILTVARLSAQKDITALLNSLVFLPNVYLTIVGDGPCRLRLENQSLALGIERRVLFLGEISPSDIESAYLDSDVFVLISHWEGFPISTLEAMSYGLPVILSDVGGSCEVFNYSSGRDFGFSIPSSNSPRLIADHISKYFDVSFLCQHSRSSFEVFSQYFEANCVCSKYAKLFDCYRE